MKKSRNKLTSEQRISIAKEYAKREFKWGEKYPFYRQQAAKYGVNIVTIIAICSADSKGANYWGYGRTRELDLQKCNAL